MDSNISSSLSSTYDPKGKKKLPSYENYDYRSQAPVWKRLKAIANGSWIQYNDNDGSIKLTKEAEKYLIRLEGESNDDYKARLAQTPYDDKFGQTLEEFTTLSFSGSVEKLQMPFALWHSSEETEASGFKPLWENIDGHHTNGDLFLYERFKEALRDGHTFVFVDYANVQPATTLAEYREAADQRRPYWIAVEAINVPNWRTVKIDGRETLVQATVRECAIAADPNSDFGEIEVEQYRTFRLFEGNKGERFVGFQLFNIKNDQRLEDLPPATREQMTMFEDMRKIKDFEVIDEGEISIAEIPLYMVHIGNFVKFGVSQPNFKAIAELNLKLYNNESDLQHIHHLCNIPVLMVDDPNYQAGDEIVLSPGKTLPVRASWLIPSPVTLAFSASVIDKLEAKIGFLKADYLRKPSDRQAAFTTTAQMLNLSSQLELACWNFCECFKKVLEATGHFLGRGYAGYILLSPQIDQRQGDPNIWQFFRQLKNEGNISQHTYRNLLKDYSLLPEWYSEAKENEFMAEEAAIAATGKAPFNPQPDLMKQVADLTLKDVIDKRTGLEMLDQAGSLPMGVTVDMVLERSGDTINLEILGSYLSQPASEDAAQGIGGSPPIDGNRLLTAWSKLAAVGSPDAAMLKEALLKYIQSPRKFNPETVRTKPTTDTILKGEPAPRGAKDNPNDRGE
jgi:Domain of unknown function (DUF4055)